jgi:hypothetical protein
MRFFISLALLLGFVTSISAQDVIIKQNGDELEVKVIEVKLEIVKYIKTSNIDGPTYNMSKTDIFMIKYENGDKEMFKDFPGSDLRSSQSATIKIKEPDNARSKNKRMAACVELGGVSANASVQFEYLCINKTKYKLGVRSGLGYGSIDYYVYRGSDDYSRPYGTGSYEYWRIEGFNIPITVTNLIGNGNHFYEGGLGVTFRLYGDPYAHMSQGYRYQPSNKKFFVTANINLLSELFNTVLTWRPGVSYGLRF